MDFQYGLVIKESLVSLHNPILRVLHKSQAVRIIDRAIQNFTGAGLGGWDIIQDGSVSFEGAGRNCH